MEKFEVGDRVEVVSMGGVGYWDGLGVGSTGTIANVVCHPKYIVKIDGYSRGDCTLGTIVKLKKINKKGIQ